MTLFQQGQFTLHSGRSSRFLIDCKTLTPEDWAAIASLVGPKLTFKDVVGVPTGGLAFAAALFPYTRAGNDYTLIVDDVLTTGNSMEQLRRKLGLHTLGVVLFSRGDCPFWIWPVFSLSRVFREETP